MQRTPLHQRLPIKRRRENTRRSLLHAIWWTFSRRGISSNSSRVLSKEQCKSFVSRTKAIYGRYPEQIHERISKKTRRKSNLIKEIRATTDSAIKNQGALIKTLEIQIGQMSKVLQEREFGSLPSSTETNPRDQVKSISTTIEADSYLIRRIGSSQYAVKCPSATLRRHFLMSVLPVAQSSRKSPPL
ncbi:hypothetical protein Tco_0153310 [Tanacetum coccineum]